MAPSDDRQRTAGARRPAAAGFSLIELIVVMTILGMLSVAVMPVFRDAMDDVQRENGVRDFIATMKYAQTRAVTEALEYRVYLHPERNKYWLERFDRFKDGDKMFTPVRDQYGAEQFFNEELVLRKPKNAHRERGRDAYYITFYPSGASDMATVEIGMAGEQFKEWSISTKGTLSEFDVEEPDR